MILELDINRKNAVLLSENDTVQYVIGIGDTDYTIHRDANDIKEMYFCTCGFFKNYSINDINNYHVFKERIKTIAGDIKWKKEIEYEGKKFKVNHSYLGIQGKCRLIYTKSDWGRFKDWLEFEGEDMKDTNEHIKFIIDVTPL